MPHLSISLEMPRFHKPFPAFSGRLPFSTVSNFGLEVLSIGSFLCVCLALIAEFS